MKVLQLTYRVPFPPTDGGAIGIFNITKGLYENDCTIDLVAINTPKHSESERVMLPYATQYDVFINTKIKPLKLLGNLIFRKIPYNIERFISKKVTEQLEALLTKNQYDFIQVEGAFVAYYIDIIRKYTAAPVIIRTHNIEYVIWQRLSSNEKNLLKKWYFRHLAKRIKCFESIYYNKADGIAAITTEDEKRLKELNIAKTIRVIPAGVVLDKYMTSEKIHSKPSTIFSISALDWMPNLEGLDWFLKNVWQPLLLKCPDTELHIAGKSTPDWLKKTAIPNTTIHGFVDDALQFKKSYQIMIVPLLSGGGMRVKIIEGLAAGKCIISTTIGAEGIDYTDKKNIIIADTPDEWVEALSHYLKNDAERIEIEKNAFTLAQEYYDNTTITKKYIELFREIKKD